MITYYLYELIDWLNPLVHIVGLGIAVWAYKISLKWGYLAFVAYFILVIFSLVAMPHINRVLAERRAPDINEIVRQEINAEVDKAIERVLQKHGLDHTGPGTVTVYFPFGPLILVAGLWLIAKREKGTEPENGGDA
ncbi:MAG TPA: hypothetical protein PKE26_17135 [Kiritimatiellia bacterium]|mgnify:CR=1 FL=1|nr:hypothetical protein [Kiritimatiellia bacterium]HMP00824.1 hypothetical protein [Kiritimatiellia bacterium]